MIPLLQERLSEFVTLWVVIDPIGSLPVFLAVAASRSETDCRVIALHSVLAAFGVLVFFIVAGQLLLPALGVPLTAFQIAGGIVLFLFALSMIFGPSKVDEDESLARQSPRQAAIFPLAIPAIASPGAMLAVVLLTNDARDDLPDQAMTVGVVIVVLAAQYVLFRLARPIERRIGGAGTSVLSRVMGTILASVAVTEVLDGVSTWLKLPLP